MDMHLFQPYVYDEAAVNADTIRKNTRSQHVLEKVGFRFAGEDETFRCTVRTSLASPLGRGGRAQRGRRGQPMTIPKDNTQLENARRLRREMTPHERKLWYLFLRKYPVKIYKQRIIGRFIVDFYCASARLVIELDGSQHYEPQGLDYDAERSQFLMSPGLEILRFSNRDIDRDFRGVCTQIDLIIRKRLQDPLSHLR